MDINTAVETVTRGSFVPREADEMGDIAADTVNLSDAQRAYFKGVLYGFAIRMIAEAPKANR